MMMIVIIIIAMVIMVMVTMIMMVMVTMIMMTTKMTMITKIIIKDLEAFFRDQRTLPSSTFLFSLNSAR